MQPFALVGAPPTAPRRRRGPGWKGWVGGIAAGFLLLILGIAVAGALTTTADTKTLSDRAGPAATPSAPAAAAQRAATEQPATPRGAAAGSFGQSYAVSQDGQPGADLVVGPPSTEATEFGGFSTPDNGQFVSFQVTFTGTGRQTFDDNPFDFYVRDAQGQHYLPGAGHDPQLDAGTLNPSEKASGYITFDAPAHGTLVYAPNAFDTSLAEWAY